MLDSHYRPVARLNTGVSEFKMTFYAISLRHLEFNRWVAMQ
jgi:hypothetical protein